MYLKLPIFLTFFIGKTDPPKNNDDVIYERLEESKVNTQNLKSLHPRFFKVFYRSSPHQIIANGLRHIADFMGCL